MLRATVVPNQNDDQDILGEPNVEAGKPNIGFCIKPLLRKQGTVKYVRDRSRRGSLALQSLSDPDGKGPRSWLAPFVNGPVVALLACGGIKLLHDRGGLSMKLRVIWTILILTCISLCLWSKTHEQGEAHQGTTLHWFLILAHFNMFFVHYTVAKQVTNVEMSKLFALVSNVTSSKQLSFMKRLVNGVCAVCWSGALLFTALMAWNIAIPAWTGSYYSGHELGSVSLIAKGYSVVSLTLGLLFAASIFAFVFVSFVSSEAHLADIAAFAKEKHESDNFVDLQTFVLDYDDVQMRILATDRQTSLGVTTLFVLLFAVALDITLFFQVRDTALEEIELSLMIFWVVSALMLTLASLLVVFMFSRVTDRMRSLLYDIEHMQFENTIGYLVLRTHLLADYSKCGFYFGPLQVSKKFLFSITIAFVGILVSALVKSVLGIGL